MTMQQVTKKRPIPVLLGNGVQFSLRDGKLCQAKSWQKSTHLKFRDQRLELAEREPLSGNFSKSCEVMLAACF